MKLAIKGHLERGKEVIKILEMMGGNYANCCGKYCDRAYYINENGYINQDYISHIERNTKFIIFSLEEFLEKFPYKVGDRVLYKIYGIYSKIKSMLWNVEKEQVFYRLDSNKLFVATADELKPCKEETMEEKEPEPKAPILSNRYDYAEGKCGYVIPDGYEFDSIKQGFQTEIILRPIKSQYPKTYEECCKIIDYYLEGTTIIGYNKYLLERFQQLLICRDAYWKIAGDWKPDWTSKDQSKFVISIVNKRIRFNEYYFEQKVLAFPTEEMRDTFYENFKDLIEQCKELL